MRLLAVLIVLAGMVFVAAPPASASHCPFTGNEASWGCGTITGSWRTGRNVKVADLKTDGHCVRVRFLTPWGTWNDMGISHCSGSPTVYTKAPGFEPKGVRIYKGWTGWYRTVE